jgi:hypothetical protein
MVTRITTGNPGGAGTTAAAYTGAVGVAVAVGDLIVVYANSNGTHVTNGMACSDAKNGAYTTGLEQQGGSSSSRWSQSFYKFATVALLATDNITVTPYAANTSSSFAVEVFRGLAGTVNRAFVGAANASALTAAAPALASAPTVGSLVVSMASTGSSTHTIASPFTLGSTGRTPTTSIGYVLAANGTSTYGVTWTAAAANTWSTETVAFDPAVAPVGVSQQGGSNTAAASFVATLATGVSAGDLDLIVGNIQAGTALTLATPAGWNLLGPATSDTFVDHRVFWRLRQAGDPATVTVSLASGTSAYSWVTAALTSVDQSSPVGTAVPQNSTASSLNPPLAALTTTGTGSYRCATCGIASGSTTFTAVPAGTTLVNSSAAGKNTTLDWAAAPTPGTVAASSWTVSATMRYGTLHFEVFRPGATAPPVTPPILTMQTRRSY